MNYPERLITGVIERLTENQQQAEAAALLGVTQASVSRYLDGQVPSLTVIRLAEILLISHGVADGIVPSSRVLQFAKSVRKARAAWR